MNASITGMAVCECRGSVMGVILVLFHCLKRRSLRGFMSGSRVSGP